MKYKIGLSRPHMSGNENVYIQQAFDANWIAPLGENVTKFEASIQKKLGSTSEVVALNSGTAAIHIALKLLGVSVGDAVICQSFTFCASANPIVYQGATPIFVDSEEDTWNMCPNLLEVAIKETLVKGKKLKGIIAVHGYGMPFQVDKIQQIAAKYKIPLVEDAAESFGSTVKNKQCGTFGDFGIISFNGNKIITTSGGGALVCKDIAIKKRVIFLTNQAKDKANHYQHSEVGYNYGMSTILAGIGCAQLEVLNDRVLSRRAVFEFYKNAFLGIPEIKFLEEPDNFYSNRWLSCLLTPSFELREVIIKALEKEHIESRPLWKPLHLQPVFQTYPAYTNGISEKLFKVGLCLPSSSSLTINDLTMITDIIKKSIA